MSHATFTYQCDGCDGYQSVVAEWGKDPTSLVCEACGDSMRWVHTRPGSDPVPDRTPVLPASRGDWQWNKATNVPSMGRHVRTDQQQHKRYQEIVGAAKRNAKRARKSMSRKGNEQCELIGRVPLEAHEGVVEALGDKLAWQKDTENLLKKTGFWTGE